MRTMLALVALLGLAAHPTMAAAPVDMAVVPAGEFTMGSPGGSKGRPDQRDRSARGPD